MPLFCRNVRRSSHPHIDNNNAHRQFQKQEMLSGGPEIEQMGKKRKTERQQHKTKGDRGMCMVNCFLTLRSSEALRHMFIALTLGSIIISWSIIQSTNNKFVGRFERQLQCSSCHPLMVSHHWLYPTNLSLLDLPQFYYLINNDICSPDIFLIIIIHSAPEHFKLRNTIRKSWGNNEVDGCTVHTAFLLAAVKDRQLQRALELENEVHRDIIQGSFLDSYKNLTYKHVMGLQWVSTYCHKAQLVLKMDDDIFVDIFQLLRFFKQHFYNDDSKKVSHLHRNIACYYQKQMPVVRDPVSKWFVSNKEFPKDTFEDYCSGWAYVTTPETAGILAQEAHSLPYFWVDDVHITGTLAKMTKVGHIHINKLFSLETQGLVEWGHSHQYLAWKNIFAPTWGDTELMKMGHKKAKMCYNVKCPCCYEHPTVKPIPVITEEAKVMGMAKLVPINTNFMSLRKRLKINKNYRSRMIQ